MTRVRPPTRLDRPKEVRNQEVRERQRGGNGSHPTLLFTFSFTNLSGFNWSILNNNVKTHLFFEFHFAAFPGKTATLSITGKSLATLILSGRHS